VRRLMVATLLLSSSWLFLAAASARAPGDACSLLSKEDAAAALGEAAAGPKATGPMSDGRAPPCRRANTPGPAFTGFS
jgi:hypothetical protein